MDCIPHNDRVELAIADLESQVRLNYTDAAKKWNIDRSTLSRRYRGLTGSKEDQYSYSAKALINVQKDVLVRYINDLSARGLLLLECALTLARDLAYIWPRCPHQYYLCATPPS